MRHFAAHQPGLNVALNKLKEPNLTPQATSEVLGIERYSDAFDYLLMSSLWIKVRSEINTWNVLLQAKETTVAVDRRQLIAFQVVLCSSKRKSCS